MPRTKSTIFKEHGKTIDQLSPEVGIMHILIADVLDVLIDIRDELSQLNKNQSKKENKKHA